MHYERSTASPAPVFWQPLDEVNFGLIKLETGVDPKEAKQRIVALVGQPDASGSVSSTPADCEVLTRAEVVEREEYRWVVQTPLGQIFYFGVWVAVFVGMAIVYQVLSTDIANMMSEYATLKAMGYSSRYLTGVVLQQSVLLALVGYVPSIIMSWLLYLVIGAKSGLPMIMTWQIAVARARAGGGHVRRVRHVRRCASCYAADPADLF